MTTYRAVSLPRPGEVLDDGALPAIEPAGGLRAGSGPGEIQRRSGHPTRRGSAWRPRGGWVLGLLLAELAVLASVNLLRFPLSVPWMRALTGETYLDMCAFCSAAEEHRVLTAFGEAGRAAQLHLLVSIDIVIPLLSAAFGIAVLAYTSRRRWLRALPVLALVLDLAENAVIASAVWAYPASPSALPGVLSGLKAIAYAATVLAAGVTFARSRFARRRSA